MDKVNDFAVYECDPDDECSLTSTILYESNAENAALSFAEYKNKTTHKAYVIIQLSKKCVCGGFGWNSEAD